jgi:hypothetical protein
MPNQRIFSGEREEARGRGIIAGMAAGSGDPRRTRKSRGKLGLEIEEFEKDWIPCSVNMYPKTVLEVQ